TDSLGDTLWTRTYGGTDQDVAHSVQQTTDGGFILAGLTGSFGAIYSDVYLVKTDSQGDTVWTRVYGSGPIEGAWSVQQTSDGRYIVAGERKQAWCDFYLLRVDTDGDTLWTRTYGGSWEDQARSVQQTTDGGYILAGSTQPYYLADLDFYLVKTDSLGDTLWTRTFGTSLDEKAWCVQQTTDGGYVFVGNIDYGGGISNVHLEKIDSSGNTLWTREYGSDSLSSAYSVQQTTDGGYIIAGLTAHRAAASGEVYLVKTDASGDTLWTRTYGGNQKDLAHSVQQTTDGGYLVAGLTRSFGQGLYDVYLLKIVERLGMWCGTLTPVFCRGQNFYFELIVRNNTGSNVSGTLTFSGHSGYDCDPGNVLVSIPRSRAYPPGVTQSYYYFNVPNAALPGEYSASIEGTLNPGGHQVRCCMNTNIVQCGPWRSGGNSEWELVEVERPEIALPMVAELYQNHPNPFNVTTAVEYELPEAGNVRLEVYNLVGKKVATLVNRVEEAGYKSVTWDASDVSSGIYFYKLIAGDFTETKRMMLVK
ncbi:MAG: T9SS type A sorting domain-containing protein, partial [Candidatus Zixiibacteriota bacterium]